MTFPDLSISPDIQGIFFRGYLGLDQAAYGLFRITDRDAFQDWLGKSLADGDITTAAERQLKEGVLSRMKSLYGTGSEGLAGRRVYPR